jgi:hypothetical protein
MWTVEAGASVKQDAIARRRPIARAMFAQWAYAKWQIALMDNKMGMKQDKTVVVHVQTNVQLVLLAMMILIASAVIASLV